MERTYILLTILLRSSGWSWVRQSPPAGAAALGSTPPASAMAARPSPAWGASWRRRPWLSALGTRAPLLLFLICLLASIDLLGDDGGSTFPQLLSDKQEGSNRGHDEIDCSEEGQGRRSDQEGIEESQHVTTHVSRIRMLNLLSKKKDSGCWMRHLLPFSGRLGDNKAN